MSGRSPDPLIRFRNGDPQAFEDLTASMGPRLLGFFQRCGAGPGLAEDLTQHVFLRVLQGIGRYRATGRWESWFLRIARNLWIDHCRRRRPFVSSAALEDAPDSSPGPPELASRSERAARIREVFSQLDPASQELLELTVFQQLPYRDVAEILGIPVGTVKSRVFYTLRRMRERADEFDPDPKPPAET